MNKDEIRKRLPEYLERLNIQIKERGHFECPSCHHKTMCFISGDISVCYCFHAGCNIRGDIFALHGHLNSLDWTSKDDFPKCVNGVLDALDGFRD